MIGRTLAVYLAARLARAVFGVLAVLFALIFVLDFVETLRRSADLPNVSVLTIAAISLFRTPSVLEQTLPFAVLFGAIGSFLSLSRRLELVVARAAGISAWQFLAPAVLVAVLIGVAATTLYNPVSARMKAECDLLEARVFRDANDASATSTVRWIRQRSVDGQAVIRANASAEQGLLLSGVTVFTFDQEGRFQERLEAQTARLNPGAWALRSVRVFTVDHEPERHELYTLATNLTAAQVQQTFAASDEVPFWGLRDAIALTKAAGLDANEYRLRYHTLLARPALLVAMVLIAATVSLRLVRMGGVGRLIVGGVVAGFVLYVATKMAGDLGTAGLVSPPAAAWSPAAIAMLIGFTILLNQEDG